MSDRCRSCAAPIRWVKSESGSTLPIDRDPTPDGNIIPLYRHESDTVVAHVLGKDETPDSDQPRFVSHFATCPNASAHRKRKDKQ